MQVHELACVITYTVKMNLNIVIFVFMEIVSCFLNLLETASVNGLIHISSSRRCTRLFWITILAMGFMVSGVLIWESFQSWADNPVRTTTKTVPMKEIKFPKLTVCPPKNTFTDLNYDLMLADNVTLTDEKKNELYEYVVAMIDEGVYMDPWDKIHEKNRFLNWYTGLTSMGHMYQMYDQNGEPVYDKNKGGLQFIEFKHEPGYNDNGMYEYRIYTSATSGVITTQNFGEIYNPSLVEERQYYRIDVSLPKSIRDNENVTLHFKLEKLNLVDSGFDQIGFAIPPNIISQPIEKDFVEKSFTPPRSVPFLDYFRVVSEKEIVESNLKLTP